MVLGTTVLVKSDCLFVITPDINYPVERVVFTLWRNNLHRALLMHCMGNECVPHLERDLGGKRANHRHKKDDESDVRGRPRPSACLITHFAELRVGRSVRWGRREQSVLRNSVRRYQRGREERGREGGRYVYLRPNSRCSLIRSTRKRGTIP